MAVAVSPKTLYEGTLTSTLATTLYTTPASTIAVATSIALCNKSGSDAYLTLTFNGYKLWSVTPVLAGESWFLGPNDFRQVLDATQLIKGGTTAGSDIDIRICGVEEVTS